MNAAVARTAAAATQAAINMAFSPFFYSGLPCPRRHAYNSTSRRKNVQDVKFNMRFVIFDNPTIANICNHPPPVMAMKEIKNNAVRSIFVGVDAHVDPRCDRGCTQHADFSRSIYRFLRPLDIHLSLPAVFLPIRLVCGVRQEVKI